MSTFYNYVYVYYQLNGACVPVDLNLIETTLTVFEIASEVSHLYFDSNSSSNQTMKSFVFNTTNELTCMDVMVFVRVSSMCMP